MFLSNNGFSVIEKEEVDTGALGNGYFVVMSKVTGIEIVLDRGQVLMKIGKSNQNKQDCTRLLDGDFSDDSLINVIEDRIGKGFRKHFSES